MELSGGSVVAWSARLGAHLEAARLKGGLRRVDLAQRLGVSEESVRLWERGAVQPSEEHLVRLIPLLSIEASLWDRSHGEVEEADDDLPAMARRLRDERAARGLTQAAMAGVMDVPQATYVGWETGRTTPSSHYHGVLADLLGTTVEEVEELSGSPFLVESATWPRFGQLIGERRAALRLTRADLAHRVGVSPKGIRNWELGHRRPRPAQLVALAEELSLPVGTLMAALPQRVPRARLGELIVTRQRELGLCSAEVARMVGTTEPTLSRWINGHSRPLAQNLERLAEALSLPLPQLHRAVVGS